MLTCESKQEILRKKQRRTPRPIGASSRFIVLLCLFDCLLCVLQCPLGAVPSNTGTVRLDFIRALHSTGDAIRVIFSGRCQEQQVFLALLRRACGRFRLCRLGVSSACTEKAETSDFKKADAYAASAFYPRKFSYSMLSSVLLSSWLIIFGLPLPLEAFMH